MNDREINAWVDWIEWLAFIREDLTAAERFQLKIEMFERFAYNIATARNVTGWL